VVAIFFGYTHCPHICSPVLATLARIREQLGSSADELQVLFITVDPEYDTVSQLSEFLPKFDPTFIGLTGEREKINEVVRNFKVYVEKQPDENNQRIISHPGGVFAIDRKGRLRLYMKEGMPMEDMVSDFRLLLSE